MELNKEVKSIAEDLVNAILTAGAYIFVTVAILFKFVVMFAGIVVVLMIIYSEVFSGNIEEVLTMPGIILAVVLTVAVWVVDNIVMSKIW